MFRVSPAAVNGTLVTITSYCDVYTSLYDVCLCTLYYDVHMSYYEALGASWYSLSLLPFLLAKTWHFALPNVLQAAST